MPQNGEKTMKKLKVLVMMILTVALVVSATACGSTSEDEARSTTATEAEALVDDNGNQTEETTVVEETPEDLEITMDNQIMDKYAADDKEGLLNPDYSAKTDIIFSEGNSEDWNYSHNKREFPVDKCYSKISTTAITKHFWGKEDEITVYYIFTGTDKCGIESTKGVVDSIKTDNSNVTIFKKILYAAKEKKAETVVSEFKLVPKEACGLRIDVIYDASVLRKYDDSSTIYFTKNQ